LEVSGSFACTRLSLPLASASDNAANRLTQWDGMALTYDLNATWSHRADAAIRGTRAITSLPWTAALPRRPSTIHSVAAYRGRRAASRPATCTTGVDGVQELDGSTPVANLLHGAGIDEALQRDDVSGTRMLLLDALGSTLALLDPVPSRCSTRTAPSAPRRHSGSASANSSQYSGRENDGTGLYYYRGRYGG
jgi:hypothetical protein